MQAAAAHAKPIGAALPGLRAFVSAAAWLVATPALAALAALAAVAAVAGDAPAVFGIPVEFILFALTLLGVALFHRHTLRVALI
jgi:hypothetical protein